MGLSQARAEINGAGQWLDVLYAISANPLTFFCIYIFEIQGWEIRRPRQRENGGNSGLHTIIYTISYFLIDGSEANS